MITNLFTYGIGSAPPDTKQYQNQKNSYYTCNFIMRNFGFSNDSGFDWFNIKTEIQDVSYGNVLGFHGYRK